MEVRVSARTPHSELLTTKLQAPAVPDGFVARQRLIREVDQGLQHGVLLVSAPAGFGKTALLADWTRRSPRPVAWLSLDGDDNDPVRFWRHAVAALDGIHPGATDHLHPLLVAGEPRSDEGFVTALLNWLTAQPDEVVLALDDYHLIDAEPVHAALRFLLEHMPPQLRVVVSARADPPLMLARLRANGRLGEIRASSLGFTAAEAEELLHGVLPAEDVEAVAHLLVARTEGWVAGLQLAALSLRDRDDIGPFLASFSGSHRYVMDYLMQEILERQPDDVRAFLRESAILTRLSGDLCDAVTGRHDSQQLLETLERDNLFVVPLDETREWWRYHQLFGDLLRARLQRLEPERISELHRRAAVWLAEHHLPDEALQHALAADEPALVARLADLRARPGSTELIEPLSERELEVLGLVAAGKANREIAAELFVTVDTVKKHVTHILGKLEVTNRTQAAARAHSLGLVAESEPEPMHAFSTSNGSSG